MSALMTKQKNSERLAAVKTSILNAVQNHIGDIERNTPKYYGMGIFAHADFLVKVVDRLTGGDASKLNALAIETIDTVENVPATSAAA